MKIAKTQIHVKFFTRPGCHLCEDAREFLREFEGRYPMIIEEINILRERKYYEKYKHTIPVIIIGNMKPIESISGRDEIQHILNRTQNQLE